MNPYASHSKHRFSQQFNTFHFDWNRDIFSQELKTFAYLLDTFINRGKEFISEQIRNFSRIFKLIDTLLTYLPFFRLSDIPNYFERNYAILKPRRSIVYIDGVRPASNGQIPSATMGSIEQQVKPAFEIRTGNWMDRNLCLMQLLTDFRSDNNYENLYIIDSDNLLEASFQEIDNAMERANFGFYTVMDKTINNDLNFMNRSELIVSEKDIQVWRYRIFRRAWRSPFFVGPKQGIRMNKKFIDSLEGKTIEAISSSMSSIEPALRNYVSDEQTLGMLLHYSGVKYTPWIKHGSHMQGPRNENPDYLVHALVHSYFGRNMVNHHKGLGIRWYYIRNKIAFLARSMFV